MIKGDRIVEFLVGRLSEHQSGKAVYWQDLLDDFSYDAEQGFENLKGFGVLEPRTPARRVFHRIMQYPYRKHGRRFRNFGLIANIASGLTEGQERAMNMDVLRQALTVALCDTFITDFRNRGCQVVIGDGFGELAGLLALYTDAQIFSVNLNEVLLVDYSYMEPVIGADHIALVESVADVREALADSSLKVVYIQARNFALLEYLSIDVAYNINSMQEMLPDVVAGYFNTLRNCRGGGPYFYCCNREMNRLADGNVLEIQKFPWRGDDELLVDELCPWNLDFYAFRPPFIRQYDGLTRHRLAKFDNVLDDK